MDILEKSENGRPFDIASIKNLQIFLQVPILKYVFQEEDKKFEKVVAKKAKPAPELSKMEEKIDSLVNAQGAQFNTVLQKLNKALERLDKVEEIFVKENKSTISSGTTFKVDHDTKCLTEAIEIKDNIKTENKPNESNEEVKLVRTLDQPMKKANSGPYKKPNLPKEEKNIPSSSEKYSSINDKSSKNIVEPETSEKEEKFIKNKQFVVEKQQTVTTWRDTDKYIMLTHSLALWPEM